MHGQQVSERKARKRKASITSSNGDKYPGNADHSTQPEKRVRLKQTRLMILMLLRYASITEERLNSSRKKGL
jgi:hypothetical protein